MLSGCKPEYAEFAGFAGGVRQILKNVRQVYIKDFKMSTAYFTVKCPARIQKCPAKVWQFAGHFVRRSSNEFRVLWQASRVTKRETPT